ncbi:hypothetical protein FVB32_16390 [Flagellimonas hymeniacidonis]|uniref:YD repeat-containing protein n=1 Tax=Flagellimonas hymeniacidonis TaxID=2603628 RepID=A0A5C8V425_9FLAO|nr:hypothetical protein [Flagellimonas hymeniacidonis]TXN36136.1 hypothetical protein FVB32_16390 [Flagellimonas hymeniacidonis]
MKAEIKIALLALIFLSEYTAVAQEQYSNLDELAKMVQIPNSPEAEAFTKYGNTSVSLYTGTPNISVPLYTHKGRELDLPMGLTYDASGIKVEQMASQVGLGWNLNVGGRISRIVNGFPDDYSNANPLYQSFFNNTSVQAQMIDYIEENQIFDGPTDDNVQAYFDFIKRVSTGEYETQPDYFSLNVLGINDYIVIDVANLEAKALENPRIKVEIIQSGSPTFITGWIVTHEDGTKFHFANDDNNNDDNDKELTKFQGDDYIVGPDLFYGLVRDYYSSWLLTKVESPNKKDVYEFDYVNLGSWAGDNVAAPVQQITNNSDDGNIGPDFYGIGYGNPAIYQSSYSIDQIFLSEIRHNTKKLVSITLGARADSSLDSAIERIDIHLPDIGETLHKYFDFDYSIFGDSQSTFNIDKRLKLDALTIFSKNNNQYQTYSFEYESPQLVPSRDALSGQDYLGYFNDKPNTVLYPRLKVGDDTYDGADRTPDVGFAQVGILKKLIYPTGGFTEFEYELHTSPYNSEDLQNETIVEVDFASGISLQGGEQQADFYEPNPADCSGIWCQDQYPKPPNVSQGLFNISEDGLYRVVYQSTGGTTQFPKLGYLFYRGSASNGGTSCSNYTALPLNQVLDLTNGMPLDPDSFKLSANGSYEGTIYLEAGCYQISMINGTIGNTSTFSVWGEIILGGNPLIGTGQEPRAGLRVKSIKDYSADLALATHKEYQYTTALDGNDSSGKIIHNPYLSYFTDSQVYLQTSANNGNPGVFSLKILNRVGHSSGGNRPHIGYSKVFEILKSNSIDPNTPEEQQRNGYTEYTFYNDGNGPNSGSGIYTTGLPPFGTYFIQNHEVGKEKDVETRTTNGAAVGASRYVYEDHLYYINKGIFLGHESGNTFKYVNKVPTSNGKYTYQYVDVEFRCLQSSNFGIGDCWNQMTAQPCDTDLYPGCINDPDLARNKMNITTAGGRIGNTIQMTRQEYNSNVAVTTVTDMEYDPAVSWQLRKSTLTGSDGETMTTQLYYPEDDPIAYSSLNTQNRLNEVVKVETLENDNVVFTRENEYYVQGDVIAPSTIKTKKGSSSSFENRAHFEYYPNGNLKVSYPEEGSTTVYLWGYDDRYPVAKIDNATYSQIENLPNFGPNFSLGSDGLTANQENSLRTHATMDQAMVTTYTYNPMVGLDTVTDPRGYVMHYIYDEFNRLKEVRDEDDNKVTDYEYHYKNQQ